MSNGKQKAETSETVTITRRNLALLTGNAEYCSDLDRKSELGPVEYALNALSGAAGDLTVLSYAASTEIDGDALSMALLRLSYKLSEVAVVVNALARADVAGGSSQNARGAS